jgi:uncharacterized protein (DUF58 family)
VRRVFPPIWPSARGIWLLLALCALLALWSVVPLAIVPLVIAAAVTAALVAADLALGPSTRALSLRREPVGFVALRRTAEVTYVLENRSGSALRAGALESPVALLDFARPELDVRVGPRSRATFSQAFVPLERGTARFRTIYCWTENAIGVLRRRFAADEAADVRVFPDLSAVAGYGNLARRRTLLEAGLRKLRLRGVGTEFESLREYAAGDAFRSVDWKASARRGRLMVAQHEVERSQQVIVALDAGRLMYPRIGPQRKFDYALTAALSVARVAQIAGDGVGLVAFAARPLANIAPRRGAAHHAALVRTVYDLQPVFEEPDYEAVIAGIGACYTKRSLVIMFTDLFDPVASATVLGSLALLVPRHLVMCVLMNDAAIARALAREPATPREAYRASVAMTLADERRAAIAILRSRGIIVIDVPAQDLTVALLDAYLDVKARSLL